MGLIELAWLYDALCELKNMTHRCRVCSVTIGKDAGK